jgi:hypothetical protein
MLIGCGQGKTTSTSGEVGTDSISTPAIRLAEENIQQDNIMNTIKEFSSEKYKGRLAGSEENRMAAQYIAEHFKKIGLENPKGLSSYMQAYIQPIVTLVDKPVLQLIDKTGKLSIDFDYPENFVLRRLSSETNRIDMKAPMYLVENLTDIMIENDNVKGKIILIPWRFYDQLSSQNEPADLAKICGALGVISEFDLERNQLGYGYLKVRPLIGSWMQSDAYKPFMFVDSATFTQLADGVKSGNRLYFSCNSSVNTNNVATNVVGLIPGSDPLQSGNDIIIGAHFDHVGDNMDGTYNPGSLDNASGVAVMMELARVIKESKIPPKKSILFIAFNGEESGVWGAQYYGKHPVYPLKKAVMINMDMIGSSAKVPLSIVTASEKSDVSLRDTFAEYADKLAITYKNGIEPGSDHVVFDHLGVPSVCLANLDFKYGYHSPHDTIEAVSGDRIKEIAKLVLYYIEREAY